MRAGLVAGAMVGLFALGALVFLMPFAYPTPPPIVTRYTATRAFSPTDLDGRRDIARVSVRLSQPSRVTIVVRDPNGAPVRALLVDQTVRDRWVRLSWQGRDDTGAPVAPGTYTIDLNARSGQKRFSKSRRIVVEEPAAAAGEPG